MSEPEQSATESETPSDAESETPSGEEWEASSGAGVADEVPAGESPPGEATPADEAVPWRRLSWRMLLVDPLSFLTRILPIYLFSLLIGVQRQEYWLETGIVSLTVLIAFLRWFSTRYRIGPAHIELRKGFFNRQVVTISRHRIRSVDTESDLFHRVMRVSIVEVGTGQAEANKTDAGRFRLNAIATSEVEPLREELLAHLAHLQPDGQDEAWGSRYGEDIARWRLTWTRFAPFSLLGFGTLFSLWLITWPMGDMHQRIMDLAVVDWTERLCDSLGPPWTIVGRALAVWLVAAVLALVAYAFRFGKYALTDHGSVLYVQNGVLRRKHQALVKARLRGVEVRMPVFLRIQGGGRLEPIMTGTKRSSGPTGTTLLPQAPLRDVRRVAARILDDELPVTVRLRRHPWRAARRRLTRGLFPFYVVAGAALLIRWDAGPQADVWLRWGIPAALVFFVLLSLDRIRMLGHALVPGFLVTSHGSWAAKRTVLEADGIIGWTVSQSVFQRWARLANVVAATPAGNGAYSVVDMEADEAWALAEAMTPGITDVWGQGVPTAESRGRQASPSLGARSS